MSNTIRPQPGPQIDFLSTPADVALTGGGAGGGKTFGLLLEGLRHIHNPNLRYTFFRRTYQQIKNQGGLWDTSREVYGRIDGAEAKEHPPTWTFPSGGEVQMRHLQYEKDKLGYQGAQIPLIAFDELTHFSESMFFYLLSRNRSAGAGFAPYVRATTNPDPDHWLRGFIDWWIGRDGYAIPERSGVIRYFLRADDDGFLWADSREALIEEHAYARTRLKEMKQTLRKAGLEGDVDPAALLIKSFTFIPSNVEDNPALLRQNPEYLGDLHSLSKVKREQLLNGNWDVRPTAGLYFKRHWLPVFGAAESLPDVPEVKRVCRYWDMAATEPHEGNKDPDYLAGLLLAELTEPHEGTKYVVMDVERHRKSPGTVKSIIQRTARKDADDYGSKLIIRMEQQPGSAGKSQIHDYKRLLTGYDFKGDKVTGDKITRAEAPSSAAEPTEERPEQKIGIRSADWDEAFLQELEGFPDANHDDQVDALSGAFNVLESSQRGPTRMSFY